MAEPDTTVAPLREMLDRRYLAPVERGLSDIRHRADRARDDGMMAGGFAGIAAIAAMAMGWLGNGGPAWTLPAAMAGLCALLAIGRHDHGRALQSAIFDIEDRLSACRIGIEWHRGNHRPGALRLWTKD